MALLSTTHRLLIGAALAAGFAAAAAPASAAGPRETVIVIGAVKDASSTGESASDKKLPMLPVVYDDGK